MPRIRKRPWSPSLEALEDRRVPTNFTPTTFADGGPGSGSLRDMLLRADADSGSANDFIRLQAGTYQLTLTNTAGQENAGLQGDLDIQSPAHPLVIVGAGSSGAGATVIDAGALRDRVFQVLGGSTQLTLKHLLLQGGLASDDGTAGALPGSTPAAGGGLLNNGGRVSLTDVVISDNVARGAGGQNGDTGAQGQNGGAGGAGQSARGGGIFSRGGSLTLTRCDLVGNQAVAGAGGIGGVGGNGGHRTTASGTVPVPAGDGGAGGAGGNAQGGGLYSTGRSLNLQRCDLIGNQALAGPGGAAGSGGFASWPSNSRGGAGGAGGAGGTAQGGGLFVAGGKVNLNLGSAAQDLAVGGAGGLGGAGAFEFNFVAGGKGGPGGPGGDAAGGAFAFTDVKVDADRPRLTGNQASAGPGGRGGSGGGGGSYSLAPGGAGGAGGTARGGGLYAAAGCIGVEHGLFKGNVLSGGQGGAGGRAGSTFAHSDTSYGPGGAGGPGGAALGGGLFATGGELGLDGTRVAYNTTVGGAGGSGGRDAGAGGVGGPGQGGGVYVRQETAELSGAVLDANRALGGAGANVAAFSGASPGAAGGPAQGGGLFASGGSLDVTLSRFLRNRAVGGVGGAGAHGVNETTFGGPGGAGGAGGAAQGGGLFLTAGLVTIDQSTAASNQAQGGAGGRGGSGGVGTGLSGFGARAGRGGDGGSAKGAGLYVGGGTVSLTRSTLSSNAAAGGAGGLGGKGGGAYGSTGQGARGGFGGDGGMGLGGGLYLAGGRLDATNDTVSGNTVAAGHGGAGGNGGDAFRPGAGGNGGAGGAAQGGGLAIAIAGGVLNSRNNTVAFNQASASQGGAAGAGGLGHHHTGPAGKPGQGQSSTGGGVFSAGPVNAVNSLFADNMADTDPEFAGNFASASHNLLRDGTGSNLAPGLPDANGNLVGSAAAPVDPLLRPLGQNGGPTLTHTLRAGSPALDAGTNDHAPATDQRGLARVSGAAIDIGAVEVQHTPVSALPGLDEFFSDRWRRFDQGWGDTA